LDTKVSTPHPESWCSAVFAQNVSGEAFIGTIRTFGMIFGVLGAVLVFNTFLAVAKIPLEFSGILGSLNLPFILRLFGEEAHKS
jgi:TRAP-type C4-dicarboxylate transport system permease large subunit